MRQFTSLLSAILLGLAIHFIPGSTLNAQCKQEGSSVVCRDARFQFLTPSFVRMEFAPGNNFVDAPSIVVPKRDWKKVDLEVWADKQWMVAKTSKIILRYKVNSGRFAKDNLQIMWREGERRITWTMGDSDKANLGGIAYSLDGARKGRLPNEQPGLLSRNGYFLFDDSHTPVWDQTSEWILPRRGIANQDIFFLAYNKDYALALKQFAELCGDIPMIPRYTFGAWVTDLNYEYLPGTEMVDKYQYDEKDVKKIVERFRNEGIPLDVLVLDYAWHKFGWKGGYDWSPVFPQPNVFLDWAHQNGIKVTLNDHPGYAKESVLSDEDSHAPAVRSELRIPMPEKPTLTINLSPTWKFRTDPADSGVNGKWSSPDVKDDGWATIQAGKTWEEQGYPGYDGVAWYRQSVFIPVNVPPNPLYLILGGVDDEYDLYINGTKLAHHGSPGSSVFNSVTYTDVNSYMGRGEQNVIALRVNDWGGGGGITAAPFILANKPPPAGIRFNLANKQHAQAFMDILHNPLIDQGVDFWWVDGGSGSCEMEGLNSQLWTNHIFYDFTQDHTKKRGFIFSRYGGWGSHRYPSFFTGDTYSQWEVLAYQVPFTAQGGNILMPYITHDIGGFIGPNVSFDLYARWLEFGAFSPFLRLHSAHENPKEGNLRMPWTYGDKGVDLARKYFRLRYSLLPYIYTYSRIAHDQALPIARPLYLEYPALAKAYSYPTEYFFGKELLVAPVIDSTGDKNIYLPPGEWIDYFTGQKYSGDRVIHEKYPLDRIPLFVKSGSIIPMQPDMAYSDRRPLDTLVVNIYASEKGAFTLYEDDGISLEYNSGKYAWTPMTFSKTGGRSELEVGPTKGTYKGQPATRAYELQFRGLAKPGSVTVNNKKIETGQRAGERWVWDSANSVAVVILDSKKIGESVKVVIQ